MIAAPQVKRPNLKVRILPPNTGGWGRPVYVRYVLYCDPPQLVGIEFFYSVNTGATFLIGSEAADAGSAGLRNLAASATGNLHLFVWDAAGDLGPVSPGNLVLRVQPFIALEGTSDTCTVSTLPPEPLPGRRQMSPEERQDVSERMKKYWTNRRRPRSA